MRSFLAAAGSLMLVSSSVLAHDLPIPTGHAPASIMSSHIHDAGEWMFGYHYLYESWDGLLQGDDRIGLSRAFMPGNGKMYMMAPTSMTMEMHMLHIMYGVTDSFTLMLMPQYMSMNMEMEMDMNMDMQPDPGGHMEMHVSGLGDTVIAGIFRLQADAHDETLIALGLSAPTGDVDTKNNAGNLVGYGMQLGSGTWDFKPSLTYKHNQGAWQLGLQVGATLRLESENDSGYQLGNQLHFSGWGAYNLNRWSSISASLTWQKTGELEGEYPGNQDPMMAISKDTDNYGGTLINAGIGMNFVIPAGWFQGHRLEFEVLTPLRQDYNGIQLDKEYSIHAAWSVAF